MFKLLSTIIDKIPTLNPTKIIGLIVLGGILFLIIFPFFEQHFFYLDKLNTHINTLKELSNLNMNEIKNNPKLKKEYDFILKELENTKIPEKIFINNNSKEIETNKFISGCIPSIILALAYLFIKQSLSKKIGGFFMLLILGVVLGVVSFLIGTFKNETLNIIIYPVLQLLLMIYIGLKTNKKKKTLV